MGVMVRPGSSCILHTMTGGLVSLCDKQCLGGRSRGGLLMLVVTSR